MKRILWIVAMAVAAGGAGCRAEHLGRNTGEAYREALAAQRSNDDDDQELQALDAADAEHVLEVHRKPAGKDTTASATSTSTMTSSSSSSSGPGASPGLWQGASGNITLEGK